jgi:hypothetical protein
MEILNIPLSQLPFVQKHNLMEAIWNDPDNVFRFIYKINYLR